MNALLHEIVIQQTFATGDMVQVKPYLNSTESGVPFEGEHSGKIGIIAASPADVQNSGNPDKVVVQVRHDDGALETFTHDIDGLVLLERRAQERT